MPMTKQDQLIADIIDVHMEAPAEGVFINAPPHSAWSLIQQVPFHPDDFRMKVEKRGFRIWKV